jgi:hypothetical protein
MSEKNRAVVRVQFGDGSHLEQFTSFRLHDAFTDPLGSYSFETRPLPKSRKDYRVKLQRGNLVTVKINGIAQGTYLITTSKRKYGRDGAIYSVECKSVLATPYEGSVDPKLNLSADTDTPISSLVLKALAPYGFKTIRGDGNVNRSAISGRDITGALPPILLKVFKAKELKAEDGETAYGFCSRIFSRLGVCLRVNAQGELILEAPDYAQHPTNTIVSAHATGIRGDYLLDGWEYTETNDGQFSECVVKGNQTNPDDTSTILPYARVITSTATGYADTQAYADKMSTGKIKAVPYGAKRANYSSTAAAFKPLIIHDKNSRDAVRAKSVAMLSLGIRARNAVTVTGTLDGMISSTGRIWGINTVTRLVLEDEEIDEPWWISERTFELSRDGGQTTSLTLLPLGALVLGEVPS